MGCLPHVERGVFDARLYILTLLPIRKNLHRQIARSAKLADKGVKPVFLAILESSSCLGD